MKLKVMLVDDEWPILNNLKMVLPWETMGLEIAALACNGQEALERFHASQPDLILCDIRMPVMDGMKFLTEVRKLSTECEILMLTGYQEFEYARTAIQHGVRDYILKPINYEQLEQTVCRIAGEIRTRRLERIQAVERWGRMAHLAYEKLLYDVLLGFSSEEGLRFHLEDELDIEQLKYTVFLVDIDHYAQRSMQWSDAERKRWNYDVTGVLQDAMLPHELPYSVLQLREGEWCVLVEHTGAEKLPGDEAVADWYTSMERALREHSQLSGSIAAYPEPVSLHELSEAYRKTQLMLLQEAGAGEGDNLAARGDQANKQGTHRHLWMAMDAIVSGLRKLDRAGMHRALQDLQRFCTDQSGQALVSAEKFLHYLIIHLLREMREMSLLTSEEEDRLWRMLQHSVSVKDVLEAIARLVDEAMEKAFSKKSSELLMISAKDYIHERLGHDLGVEELADYLGISCSYFSMLFKSHFGETFVEYVTRQRMELARSLLVTTDKTVTEIGSLTGYSDRRYFTKVFQKFNNATPSEYREQFQGNA